MKEGPDADDSNIFPSMRSSARREAKAARPGKEQKTVSDSLIARPYPQERNGLPAASHTKSISNHFLALPICGGSKNGGNVRAKLVGV